MNDSRLGRVCSGISAANIVSGGGQAGRSGEYRLLGPAGASGTGPGSFRPGNVIGGGARANGLEAGGGLSAPVEVFEDFFDHGSIFDARDYLDRTGAVVTGHRDVAGGRWFVGRLGITLAASGRRHLLTQSMVRRDRPMVSGEVDLRRRHQGGQAGDKIRRASCPSPCGCSKSLPAILSKGSNTPSVVPSRYGVFSR